MSRSEPLVKSALRNARLADSQAVREFWEKTLGGSRQTHKAYYRYSVQVPLDKRVIFYETMSGDRMNDNPYAIFRYLRSHPEYGSFLHVWSLGAHGTIPEEFANADDVVFAPRDTLAYAYFLACAGHIIGNAILPNYLTRRDGQKYLNTWHGIPYKTLGRSAARARFGTPSGIGTFVKATHVVTPCEFMTEALLHDYSMTGTSTALVAETGYPRIDLTVNATSDDVSRLRRAVGIDERQAVSAERPVVLYAPTWRSDGDGDTVDTDQLLRDLDVLAQLDIQLIYRGHHRIGRLIQDRAIGEAVGRVIVPPQEISSNELLAAVDILITDYSSIFFDFLPTGRPIVHYLYDLDEYASTRGLNLGADELPGEVARSEQELVDAVNRAAAGLRGLDEVTDLPLTPLQGERYRAAQRRFAPHEDGFASRRAVDFFFRDETPGVPVRAPRDGRPTAVFWAGSPDAGEEASTFLRRAVEYAGTLEHQVTLVIDRDAPIDRDIFGAMKILGDKLSVISYGAFVPMLLPAETANYHAFIDQRNEDLEEIRDALQRNANLYSVFSRRIPTTSRRLPL